MFNMKEAVTIEIVVAQGKKVFKAIGEVHPAELHANKHNPRCMVNLVDFRIREVGVNVLQGFTKAEKNAQG